MTQFGPGVSRGLDCLSGGRGTFAVLALDHRQGLRRILDPAHPGAVADRALIDFKLAAVASLGPDAPAFLLDPETGALPALSAGSLPRTAGLMLALEETGYDGPSRDRGGHLLPGWDAARARRIGADAVKLLVYYRPDAEGAARQEAWIAGVADACAREDVALVLEPLGYGRDGGPLPDDERRDVVIESARRLSPLGAHLLKVEFPAPATADGTWPRACRELDEASAVPWTVLSGGVAEDVFERQVAAAVAAGASGLVAGRSIWGEAVTMPEPLRSDWLRRVGAERMRRLARSSERARPWRDAMQARGAAGMRGSTS